MVDFAGFLQVFRGVNIEEGVIRVNIGEIGADYDLDLDITKETSDFKIILF